MRWDILLLLLAAVACVPSERPPVRGMYSRHKRSTDESEHTIVYPRKVTDEGNLISHDVTHYHDGDEEKMLHLRVAVAGSEYHMELKPVVNLVSSGMVVHRWSFTSMTHDELGPNNCHFQGRIRGDPTSYVSISTCDGLAGVLLVDNGTLWVEPVEEVEGNGARTGKQVESGRYAFATNASAASSRPHLVSRRSADVMGAGYEREETSEGTCGTSDPPETEDEADDDQGRNETNHWRRVRRSFSSERYVETLVVAAPDVTNFYKNLDAKIYFLTIFNIVAGLLRHPSVGNDLNIVVVGIILLTDPDPKLNISSDVEKTLKEFCAWRQRGINGNGPLPHHDVAVLVTRTAFCKESECTTLGVAHVRGTCKPDQSCLVTRDNGMMLAYTIAHELGHNLGAHHDDQASTCFNKTLQPTIMVPVLSGDRSIDSEPWSNCSRKAITNYLDREIGDCLDNKPTFNQDYEFPYLQHGAMYDSAQQCQIAFNVRNSYVCDTSEICEKLWCQVDGSCQSHIRPAAPGTNCGRHMWCQDRKCVPITERPKPINGNWGNWTLWSKCEGNPCSSKGISIRERPCTHPLPKNGGRFCIGRRREVELCETDCPTYKNRFNDDDEKIDLRVSLCKSLGLERYPNNTDFIWTPIIESGNPCLLFCEANGNFTIQKNDLDILNGLPCGSNSVCVYGMCYKYGCDGVIGSKKVFDRCGDCGGNGTTCKTVSGWFNNTSNREARRRGYLFALTIPRGSRNLNISEPACLPTNIAIGSTNNRDLWYFHGNLTDAPIPNSKTIGKIAGASAEIDVNCGREKITFFQPIQDDINVYCHVQNNASFEYCMIKYAYDKLLMAPTINRQYSWTHSEEPLPCSVTCGKGNEYYPVICVEQRQRTPVDEKFCSHEKKLLPRKEPCGSECLASWWTGDWQPCSTTCGKGRQTRSVLCISESVATVDSDCDKIPKPEEFQPCSNDPCYHGNRQNSNDYKNSNAYNKYIYNEHNQPSTKNSERYRIGSHDSKRPLHQTQGPTHMSRSRTSGNERMMSPKRSLSICSNQMAPNEFKICNRSKKRRRSHLCMQKLCPNGKTGCKTTAGKCIVDKNFCDRLKSPKQCCPKCMRRRRHGRSSPRKKFRSTHTNSH